MEEKKEDPSSKDLLLNVGVGRFSLSSEEGGGIDWWRKLRQLLFSLVVNPRHTASSEQDIERRRKLRSRTAVAIATFLLVWLCAARRRRRSTQHVQLLSACLSLLKKLTHKEKGANSDYRSAVEAPLSLLIQAAKTGSVSQALLMTTGSDPSVAYQVDGVWKKSALPPNNPSFQSNLLEMLSDNGCTDVSALPESVWSRLVTPALAALPFVYLFLTYRMMRTLYGKDDAARTYREEEEAWQQTTFDHVAGMDNAVAEVSEVVTYLSDPSRYHGLGARPPRAILLYGPPGLGKTLLARAVAGEAHCSTFVACSGSDFVDTYVGRGAARVRKLFDQARKEARRGSVSRWWWPHRLDVKPRGTSSALIFIDEIDALAKSRSVSAFGNNDEREQTLNQLLSEMDGFAEHSDVTTIIIAATNRPDVLDPAFLRRFDRQIHVSYPNTDGRRAILLVHARRVNCRRDGIDWNLLASSTGGFSGAELRNVVNEAALLAVREQRSEVEQRHFEMAVERVKRMKAAVQNSSLPIHLAVR